MSEEKGNTIASIEIRFDNDPWLEDIFEVEDEIEPVQKLTVDADGNVDFYAQVYSFVEDKKLKPRRFDGQIPVEVTNVLYSAVLQFIIKNEHVATDYSLGLWHIVVTFITGEKYQLLGSTDAETAEETSNILRQCIPIPGLRLFDGNFADPYDGDEITRLTLNYHRKSKLPRPLSISGEELITTWRYTESLVIDGETETVQIIQNLDENSEARHFFKMKNRIKMLMDDLKDEGLLKDLDIPKRKTPKNPDETITFELVIEYAKRDTQEIKGRFDLAHLPENWFLIVDAIQDTLDNFGKGEILHGLQQIDLKSRKKQIVCGVSFQESDEIRYYITDNKKIQVGDLVEVPLGYANSFSTIGYVETVEMYAPKDVPFPMESAKHILHVLNRH
ncbi:hypothetical protein [Aerococcus sp. 1KP-2016]|uniref:hypothetical protein n=1 Tax=Aerococcus sp. 1KP-2016 TaxID=1981982 RepID=UPI000B98EBD2|nr:hypothetical protein [Aerococcus sp. 1KP-2016]OYQ67969.1 hypothetical protein B9P78_01690 [Aerococcus sp. 1KP-2016]